MFRYFELKLLEIDIWFARNWYHCSQDSDKNWGQTGEGREPTQDASPTGYTSAWCSDFPAGFCALCCVHPSSSCPHMWLLYPGTCYLILGHEVCWSRQSKSILVAVPERTVGARESRSLPFWNRSGALTSFYPCSQESHTLHQSQFGTGIFPCGGRERTEGE